jgi:pimeloyl-ACP methyl ester carboxylesterase
LPEKVQEGIDAFTERNPDHWRYMASEWATPYFHYVLNLDPYPMIPEISCPVLSLIGEKDVLTVPGENSLAIKHALENGKCEDYRVEIVENVDYLFQQCETGAISEYSQLEETFNAAEMEDIAKWIIEHVR